MASEETGSRSHLEWVSCPNCSTTFRVAVPSQYMSIEIEQLDDEDDEAEFSEVLDQYDGYQRVKCQNPDCLMPVFYLGLDREQPKD